MRFLWVVFLLVLLPLRGWAGQLMAVDMAMQQTAQAVAMAIAVSTNSADRLMQSHPSESMAVMPDDCPMHVEATPRGSMNGVADASIDSVNHCSGCDTCELCLAIASFSVSRLTALPTHAGSTPDGWPRGFRSADRASRLKPPIS